MQYSSMIGWSEFPHQIIHVRHVEPMCLELSPKSYFSPDCGEASANEIADL